MTRPLIAMFACYALGLVAGRQQIHCVEAQRSVSTEPAVQQDTKRSPVVAPVIKTPLVEKVLPKPVVKQSLTTEPTTRNYTKGGASEVREQWPTVPVDGQLSPRGEWRWNLNQQAWVPVEKPGPRWHQDGHSATVDHLVRDHGYRRADLVRLTQSQLDVLHSNAHNAARARRVSAPTYSACPSGRCPRR